MMRILQTILATALALLAVPAVAAPAMWEVSDTDSKVVLFGSFHILPENTAWRTPLFDAALAQSKLVYFETDIGPLGMIALTIKMVGLAFQQRPSWVSELTPDQLQLLTEAIKPIGMSLEEADLFPPWVTTLRLSMSPAIDPQGGGDGAPAKPAYGDGVDSALQWELPKERKAYLETSTQQYDVLAAGSIPEQID
ncbi:MAG TPA: TraB/GumN family protein, partial [Devosia sp.]|nr:TraB/GumN family protein [Devosia sp.]